MANPLALLVEENELVAAPLSHWLQGCGARTTLARDGRRALEMMRGQRPDLVLVDLITPLPSEHELLAELEGDPTLHSLPVMVISSAERTVGNPERDYPHLRTPLDRREFEQVIRSVLDASSPTQASETLLAPVATPVSAPSQRRYLWPPRPAQWLRNASLVWGSLEEYVWYCRPEGRQTAEDDAAQQTPKT